MAAFLNYAGGREANCIQRYMCVCARESVFVFDVVFTQLKAVSCVVSPQSYPPFRSHTSSPEALYVCYAKAYVHVCMYEDTWMLEQHVKCLYNVFISVRSCTIFINTNVDLTLKHRHQLHKRTHTFQRE